MKDGNEADNQKAISSDITKLTDQCIAVKRAITIIDEDVNECMLHAEFKKR